MGPTCSNVSCVGKASIDGCATPTTEGNISAIHFCKCNARGRDLSAYATGFEQRASYAAPNVSCSATDQNCAVLYDLQQEYSMMCTYYQDREENLFAESFLLLLRVWASLCIVCA